MESIGKVLFQNKRDLWDIQDCRDSMFNNLTGIASSVFVLIFHFNEPRPSCSARAWVQARDENTNQHVSLYTCTRSLRTYSVNCKSTFATVFNYP